jgi:beta-N-acetylhexosaminidase
MPRLNRAFAIASGMAALSTALALHASPAAEEASRLSSAAPDASVHVIAADDESTSRTAEDIVAAMSVEQRAASVVMGHVAGTDPDRLAAYMRDTGIGGFILMGANVPGDEERLREITAALTVDQSLPPLLAIDQEGGDVTRLPWDGFPSSLTLKSATPDEAEQAFSARAALVMRSGIGVNFGIVADVAPDRASFIHRRSLGTTPSETADRVAAAVAGEAPGVLSTLKHFPGHGAAPGDSHVGIPRTSLSRDAWERTDGRPFVAGVEAGAPLLMFGHLAYTDVDDAPASLSPEWHRIAREDLGFDGVAITDDLGMLQASGARSLRDPVRNGVRAIAAGNDMVLTVMFSDARTAPRIAAGIADAVADGSLPAERLDDAAQRVMELRLRIADAGGAMLPCQVCEPVG